MAWCFALVNGRLAEIYFKEGKGRPKIWAHCYIKKEDFKTKREQKQIASDTRRVKVVYRNKQYRLKPNSKNL